MHALADESGRLVHDLHATLSDIDPARWHAGAADRVRAKLTEIRARTQALAAAKWPATESAFQAMLAELERQLARDLPATDQTMGTAEVRWMAFKRAMVPSYEALRRALERLEIHVPSLRPTNYKRNLLHVCSAGLALFVLWVVPDPFWAIFVALPLVTWAWTMETMRRTRPKLNAFLMGMFDPIAHPHEHRRVNSATWYLTALMALSLTQTPLPCAIGLATLGLGDPAAALIGRRFGRIKLLHGRTLEGSLAFVGAATLGSFAIAYAFAPTLAWTTALAIASAGAVAGAVAELVSLRVDDNLSVPLSAAAGAAIAIAFIV